MSLNAKQSTKKSSGFTKPTPNKKAQVARIVGIVDMGVQHVTSYQKPYDPLYWNDDEKTTEVSDRPVHQAQVQITFELVDDLYESEGEMKPIWAFKTYPISTHEKSGLYNLMTSCDEDPLNGNVGNLLGKAVQVKVDVTEGGNPKIVTLTDLMDADGATPLHNPTYIFDLDSFDQDVFDQLAPWLQDKINDRVGAKPQLAAVPDTTPAMDDDIPF